MQTLWIVKVAAHKINYFRINIWGESENGFPTRYEMRLNLKTTAWGRRGRGVLSKFRLHSNDLGRATLTFCQNRTDGTWGARGIDLYSSSISNFPSKVKLLSRTVPARDLVIGVS